MPKYSKLMIGYGVLCAATGIAVWAAVDFSKAGLYTSFILCGVIGLVMVLMGVMSSSADRKKMMIGIHIGLIVPLLFALAAGGRTAMVLIQDKDIEKHAPLIGNIILVVASIATFLILLSMRPKKSDRKPAE